jgi:hypothetical protein
MGYYDEREIKDTSTTKIVIARKARGDIQPGDLVQVTRGFEYEVGGKRTGYFSRSQRLVAADGSYVAFWAVSFRDDPRLSALQREAIEESIERAARSRAEIAAQQAALKAEGRALLGATWGSQVTYRGRTWEVLAIDYYPDAAGFNLIYKFKLKDIETGEIREAREVRD